MVDREWMGHIRCSEYIDQADTTEQKLRLIRSQVRLGLCRRDPGEIRILRSIAEDERLTDELRWRVLGVCEYLYDLFLLPANMRHNRSYDLNQYPEIAATVYIDADASFRARFLDRMEMWISSNADGRISRFALAVLGEIALDGDISSSLRYWIIGNLERARRSPDSHVRRESLRAFRRIIENVNTDPAIMGIIRSLAERDLEDINDRDEAVLILRSEALSTETSTARREEIVNLLEEEYQRCHSQSIVDCLFDIAINVNTERYLREEILARFIDWFSEMPSYRNEHFRARLERLASSPLTEPWMVDMAGDMIELIATLNGLMRDDNIIIF